jgi:hypothetical protein
MAPRTAATFSSPAMRAPVPRRSESLTFVCDGKERRVSLRAPTIIRRDGRRLVALIDLWVASLLPGDLLELSFEIVTSGPGGELDCSAPIDAMLFARGFVDLGTGVLRWNDPGECSLDGRRARSVVVHLPVEPILPAAAPTPAPPEPISVADLQRLLPLAACAYPAVKLCSAPVHPPAHPREHRPEETAQLVRHRIAC